MGFTVQHWNGEVCIRDKTSADEALARMMRVAHPAMEMLAWQERGRGGPISPRFLEKDGPQVCGPTISSKKYWTYKVL